MEMKSEALHVFVVILLFGFSGAIPLNKREETDEDCYPRTPIDSHDRAPAKPLHHLPDYPHCGLSKYDKRNADSLRDMENLIKRVEIQPETKRVVGGTESKEGIFPWQVGLTQAPNQAKIICGGAIIEHRWVLTAAHCFDEDNVPMDGNKQNPCDFSIHAGENRVLNPSEDLQLIGVEEIITHAQYSKDNFDNDIALLKLTRDVDLGYEDSNVLCLPTDEEDQQFDGDSCTSAGWGSTASGEPGSEVLLHAVLPQVNQTTCREMYPHQITENMFCAGYLEGGMDSCQGDSGGPLFCQQDDGSWVQIGVTSWGKGCAQEDFPGVYADVRKYIDWIQDILTRYSDEDYDYYLYDYYYDYKK